MKFFSTILSVALLWHAAKAAKPTFMDDPSVLQIQNSNTIDQSVRYPNDSPGASLSCKRGLPKRGGTTAVAGRSCKISDAKDPGTQHWDQMSAANQGTSDPPITGGTDTDKNPALENGNPKPVLYDEPYLQGSKANTR